MMLQTKHVQWHAMLVGNTPPRSCPLIPPQIQAQWFPEQSKSDIASGTL